MELDELAARAQQFCRSMLGDPAAEVVNFAKTTGHAGFSYLFDVVSRGGTAGYFLRLPPPGVKYEGTGDVLRQVAALNAMEGTAVPHARVVWSGDDPQWFGSPYFVTEKVPGDLMRMEPGQWGALLSQEERRRAAEQVMTALAGIHRAEWQEKAAYLGEPRPFAADVTQWDRLYERAADSELLAEFPAVRERLLVRAPAMPHVGIFHGDFQWTNLLFTPDATLTAVIDWELCGIGATLNDLGWFQVFNDARAWAHEGSTYGNGMMPDIDELSAMYTKAFGSDPGDIGWFRALAAYKFAVITGFNLMLHRRGKRDDPSWEVMAASMPSLMAYAIANLGG